ncbi:FTR1 family protein [Streptomyces sp. NBC_01643]|uniref:FTR1 family protein n=1 Tax=Streptomyces sp. NBC_01643 TaxID=2975906 RepID=UPI00386C1B05
MLWLVVIVAGVLAYGVQEASNLPGLQNLASDTSSTTPKTSWYRTLLKGIFNFQPDPTVLQLAIWALYGGPGPLLLLPQTLLRPLAPEPAETEPAA